MKRICFISGTRAEYGLLKPLIEAISDCDDFVVQIIATGMHLSPEFGLTFKEIENDGFSINRKIEMLLSSDTASSISKSTGLGLIGFSDAYSELYPDIIVILGDRFEMLSASIAALYARIPIAHIHGGESTAGAFDDTIRHSITKMSWWHFVANDEYKKRVVQLGENPKRVFNVGGLGVDAIKKTKLLSKTELTEKTGIKFNKKNLLITYHPVTLDRRSSKKYFQSLLDILASLDETYLIFTMPNADSDGRIIKQMINDFVLNNTQRSISFISMGHLNYSSTMQFVDCVVGNSSSGLAEAPTFKIGTINIGDRQRGRIKAESVIDCEAEYGSIKNAFDTLYSEDFQKKLLSVKNPYGKDNAIKKILKVLKTTTLPNELKKDFFDL